MQKNEEVMGSGIFDYLVFPVPNSSSVQGFGDNKKGLLVILGEKSSMEMKAFLGKILASVGFDLERDALLLESENGERRNLTNITQNHGISHTLVFGIQPSDLLLNINAPSYRPFKMDGISFLFVDQLSAIHNDAKLKRPLWEALKAMFPTE